MGGRSAKNLPSKPEALILYEQIKELGIPLVDGGLVDQPHIWMEQYAICAFKTEQWDIIDRNAQKGKAQWNPQNLSTQQNQ